MEAIVGGLQSLGDLGQDFGGGLYEVSYAPESLGTFEMLFSGEAGLDYQTISIEMRQPAILDYVFMYWYLIPIIVALISAISYSSVRKILSFSRIESFKSERRKVQDLQKGLQDSYFKRNEIDRQTFEKRSQELEERLRKLDENIKSRKR